MPCEHTHLEITRHILKRDGRIEAFDAIYSAVCPFCGAVRRNTRLSDTIFRLRQEGMNIVTERKPGRLAVYVLVDPQTEMGL